MKIEALSHSPLIYGYTILKHVIYTKQIIDNKILTIIKTINRFPKSFTITDNSYFNLTLSFLFLKNTLFNLFSSIKKYPITYDIIPLTAEVYTNWLNLLGTKAKNESSSSELNTVWIEKKSNKIYDLTTNLNLYIWNFFILIKYYIIFF